MMSMQLSNKILIGFFCVALVYLLAAFAEVRFRGYNRSLNGTEIQIENASLNNVGYIVLSDSKHRVIISQSDSPRIEVRSIDGGFLSGVDYDMVGDTLTLKAIDIDPDKPVQITIYVNQNNLRGIQATQASAKLSGLVQPTLAIAQSGGSIVMDEDVDVTRLHITASEKAHVEADGLQVDSLFVQLDHSVVMIRSTVKLLEGGMTNESHLMVMGANDIQFKKDESSRLQVVE